MTTENQIPAEGTAANPSFSPPPGIVFANEPEQTADQPVVPPLDPPTREVTFGPEGVVRDTSPQPFPEAQAPAPAPTPSAAPVADEDESEQEEPVREAGGILTDLSTLIPESRELELSDGRTVLINELRTRELLKLLRVIVRGGGPLIASLDFSSDDFAGRLIAVVVFSIPEAEDEAIEFIQSLVNPVGLLERPRSKADREYNEELRADLDDFLSNPELEDTVSIITTVVRFEAVHIQALGKQIQVLLPMASAIR